MSLPRLDRPGDFIDGAFRNIAPADGELRVESPADTNDITAVYATSAAAPDAAVAAARSAFPGWRKRAKSASHSGKRAPKSMR
jgi:acyl-CoA reductase-like NAD-dependent aldehyde dehydrogenase